MDTAKKGGKVMAGLFWVKSAWSDVVPPRKQPREYTNLRRMQYYMNNETHFAEKN